MTTTDYVAAPRAPRPRGVVTLGAAIAALFVTAVFGLASVADDESASAPEVAVRQLLTAANNSDVLGALQALLPAEREALRQPFVDLVAEAKRLGLANDGIDLSHVGGLTVRFQDVKTTVKTLTPDIAVVTLTGGKLTSFLDPKRLAGPLLADVGIDVGQPTPQETLDITTDEPVDLVTVRSGDRWYVSFAYSIAESARKDSGGAQPDFGSELQAKGEPTPERAVDTAVRAALAGDFERVVALVGSAEGRVLRDYAPLFLPLTKGGPGVSPKVRRLDLVVTDRSGDSAKVAIKAFDIELSLDGSPGRFAFDGKCATVTFPGEKPQRTCSGDALTALPFGNALPSKIQPGDVTVAVVQENGAWFISPTRTVTDLLLKLTHQFDRQTLTDTITKIKEQITGEPTSA